MYSGLPGRNLNTGCVARVDFDSLTRLTNRLAALEAVPSPTGDGWRVFIQWVNGRMQYVSGFESLQEAEKWITNESEGWLRLVGEAQL